MENNVSSNNSNNNNNNNNNDNDNNSSTSMIIMLLQIVIGKFLNSMNEIPSKINMYSTHNIKETGNIPYSHQQSLSKNLTNGCTQFLGYLSKLYKPDNNVIFIIIHSK